MKKMRLGSSSDDSQHRSLKKPGFWQRQHTTDLALGNATYWGQNAYVFNLVHFAENVGLRLGTA